MIDAVNIKRVLTVALFALLALFLSVFISGCSSGSDSAGGKTYKIVTDSIYAPFEFEDSNNTYVGIDIDLFDAIAKQEGFTYEMTHPGFDAAIQAVAGGQADGAIAGMSITEPRKETYDFSDPYYKSGSAFATTKAREGEFKTYDDLKGKKIGVKMSTTSADWLAENKETYGFEITEYEDGILMYSALKSGSVDALMDDGPIIGYAITQGEDLGMPFADKMEASGNLGFAVKKGENSELLSAFNSGLAKIIASGEYANILAKYGAESGAIS